jgi:hypothetical protein
MVMAVLLSNKFREIHSRTLQSIIAANYLFFCQTPILIPSFPDFLHLPVKTLLQINAKEVIEFDQIGQAVCEFFAKFFFYLITS